MPLVFEPDEMYEELRRLYAQDAEAKVVRTILRCVADPVKPQADDGRFRPHPLIVWLGLTTLVTAATFCYCAYVQP